MLQRLNTVQHVATFLSDAVATVSAANTHLDHVGVLARANGAKVGRLVRLNLTAAAVLWSVRAANIRIGLGLSIRVTVRLRVLMLRYSRQC